jgi:hypothetical protein
MIGAGNRELFIGCMHQQIYVALAQSGPDAINRQGDFDRTISAVPYTKENRDNARDIV